MLVLSIQNESENCPIDRTRVASLSCSSLITGNFSRLYFLTKILVEHFRFRFFLYYDHHSKPDLDRGNQSMLYFSRLYAVKFLSSIFIQLVILALQSLCVHFFGRVCTIDLVRHQVFPYFQW